MSNDLRFSKRNKYFAVLYFFLEIMNHDIFILLFYLHYVKKNRKRQAEETQCNQMWRFLMSSGDQFLEVL